MARFTDNERLAILETEITYIKDKTDKIDNTVSQLNTWKLQVIAGSSVISSICSVVLTLIASYLFNK